MTLILLWARKRIKLLLDGWSHLSSPTSLRGPQIQTVTGKLFKCILPLKALRTYFMQWFASDTYKFILKLNFVVCFVMRGLPSLKFWIASTPELLWSASRKYIMCYWHGALHSRIWLFQGVSLSFSLRLVRFFLRQEAGGLFQFWIWDWPWVSKTSFEMWIFLFSDFNTGL